MKREGKTRLGREGERVKKRKTNEGETHLCSCFVAMAVMTLLGIKPPPIPTQNKNKGKQTESKGALALRQPIMKLPPTAMSADIYNSKPNFGSLDITHSDARVPRSSPEPTTRWCRSGPVKLLP
jgi:hypothetical protein